VPVYNSQVIDQNRNPHPTGLRINGPVVQVEVGLHPALAQALVKAGKPVPAQVPCLALIDTGASNTCVDMAHITALQIPPIQTATVHTPNGATTQTLHPASIAFPGTGLPTINFNSVVCSNLTGQSFGCLIGRDVLEHFVLVYNGPFGAFTLAM